MLYFIYQVSWTICISLFIIYLYITSMWSTSRQCECKKQLAPSLGIQNIHRTGVEPVPLAYIEEYKLEGKHDTVSPSMSDAYWDRWKPPRCCQWVPSLRVVTEYSDLSIMQFYRVKEMTQRWWQSSSKSDNQQGKWIRRPRLPCTLPPSWNRLGKAPPPVLLIY